MNFLRQVRSKADEVALEADKALRIQRKQGEIGQLQKQVQQRLAELGSAAYGMHQQGQALPVALLQICQGIDGLFNAIREQQNEIEAIRRETVPAAPAVGGLRCSSCGQPLPADAAFCHYCGTRVPPPKSAIECNNCGTSLPADARFCANCGQSIAQPAASSSTQAPAPAPPTAVEPTATVAENANASSATSCRTCGAGIEADAIFCPVCGAPVQDVESSAIDP